MENIVQQCTHKIFGGPLPKMEILEPPQLSLAIPDAAHSASMSTLSVIVSDLILIEKLSIASTFPNISGLNFHTSCKL